MIRMPTLIAWRNLTHDRVRFAVTVVGIAFSVILIGFQLGLLLNFVNTTRILIDNSKADIWLVAKGTKAIDLPSPLDQKWKYQALTFGDIERAEGFLLNFAQWQHPDGQRVAVMAVATEGSAQLGGAFQIVEGLSADELRRYPDAVAVDKLYAAQLGVTQLGQTFEVNGVRVRVMAFTDGIRTFTISPYVFMNMDMGRAVLQAAAPPGFFNYVMLKVRQGEDPERMRATLAKAMPDVDVLTSDGFAALTASYWLLSTGAGVSLVMAAFLGFVVGGVVVAQTLYASTMDRLPEYATLRAMGIPKLFLTQTVMQQSLIGGGLGYLLGMAVVLWMVVASASNPAGPQMPLWLILSIALATLVTCALAALVSIKRVYAINPLQVFR